MSDILDKLFILYIGINKEILREKCKIFFVFLISTKTKQGGLALFS